MSKKQTKLVEPSDEQMEKMARLHKRLRRYEKVDTLFRKLSFRVFTLILMGCTIFNTIHLIRSLI